MISFILLLYYVSLQWHIELFFDALRVFCNRSEISSSVSLVSLTISSVSISKMLLIELNSKLGSSSFNLTGNIHLSEHIPDLTLTFYRLSRLSKLSLFFILILYYGIGSVLLSESKIFSLVKGLKSCICMV